jgi:hypothetical protein
MGVLDLKRFEQIEEMIETVHKAFPHLPKSGRRLLTELLPYMTFVAAISSVFLAAWLFFDKNIPLFTFNKILLQLVLLLCSGILIMSYKPLSLWAKKGWYNVFYVSLIQLLLTLMFFNVYTFAAQILAWYVLFEVKKEYS